MLARARASAAVGWQAVLAASAALVGMACLAPDGVRAALAKEGPAEHLGHAALLATTVVLLTLGLRARRAAPVLLGCFALLNLGEEVDWGAVYGVGVIGDWIAGHTGGPRNLHNALGGASYLLFALPWAAWVLLPGRVFALAPPPWLRGAALCLGGLALSLSLALPRWESEVDEGTELLWYLALLIGVGSRHVRAQLRG